MSDARQFFPGIQALRAIAATLVVIEHAGAASLYRWYPFSPQYCGRIGVILFFAISGFVIALQRRKAVGEFVAHRLLRIYPSYWLAMVLAAIVLGRAGQLVSANFYSISLVPSNIAEADASLQIPYWTLAFEMTFYALAAVAFGFRLSDRNLTIIAAVWIVAVNCFAPDPKVPSDYSFPGAAILLSSVVQVFPIGLICGIHFDYIRRAGRLPFLLACAVALIASISFAELSVLKTLMLGLASSALMLAVADLDMHSRIVRFVGDASYGVYLMHFPAITFVTYVVHAPGFLWLLLVGMTAGIGYGWLDHGMNKWMVAKAHSVLRRSNPTSSPQI